MSTVTATTVVTMATVYTMPSHVGWRHLIHSVVRTLRPVLIAMVIILVVVVAVIIGFIWLLLKQKNNTRIHNALSVILLKVKITKTK